MRAYLALRSTATGSNGEPKHGHGKKWEWQMRQLDFLIKDSFETQRTHETARQCLRRIAEKTEEKTKTKTHCTSALICSQISLLKRCN